MNQLLEILKSEGRRVVEEFNLASHQGEGTPQEVADFREGAIHDFLKRYLPMSHIVSKGKITDLEGNQSASIDCLILNPAHPNLVDSKGKHRINFSDGCDVAIEIKPDLARGDELKRALEQCITVKKTKRSRSAILVRNRNPPHLIEHSLYVPFFVFALKAFAPERLCSEIRSRYAANRTPTEHQLDGVCIHGVGMLKNHKHKELNMYGAPFPVGQNTGWYLEKWGDATLLGLLINIEYSYPSVPSMEESIMKRVLAKVGKTAFERLGDAV